MAQYLDESTTFHKIPPHIWNGLKMEIKKGKPWMPENKRDCIKKKLRARVGKNRDGYLAFYDIRIPGDEHTFSFYFFPVFGRQPPNGENSGIMIVHDGEIMDPPWEDLVGQPKLDALRNFAEQNSIELPEDWDAPHQLDDTIMVLDDAYDEMTYGVFVTQFAETLYPILESCTDEGLRQSIRARETKTAAIAVGAEKGLPPLALESYLGVPEPARGSPEMKKYWKEHGQRSATAFRDKEEQQSEEAVAAMKAGRKKSRRAKKTRGTRRR